MNPPNPNLPRFFLRGACGLLVTLAGGSLLTTSVRAEATPPVRLQLDVDRVILPAGTRERAIVKVGLDCLRVARRDQRPPVNLALVIDRSGSMSGEKIAKAREAALEAVRRLAPEDIVAVIAYDTRVQTLVPAQRVGDGRRLEAAIHAIAAGGNTALHGGVVRGAEEVRRHAGEGGYVDRVILLSDGLANVGPSSPAELGRLGTQLGREGISVTTIGLGLGYQEELMTRLAQRSDGNTYFVEHGADLPRIFAAELGDVLSVVARAVVIEVTFPDGVRPLRFVGRDGEIRGQCAELTLNQLYAGQEKFALVEVEVLPQEAGAELELARASVRFEDALTRRRETVGAARRVSFSASRPAVVASADHRVQHDYALNLLAAAKEEAVNLVDANRRDAAAGVLRARTKELQDLAETYGNRSVGEAAAALAPAAARVEREGLGNAERKIYRAEAAQTVNQQSNAYSSSPGSRE